MEMTSELSQPMLDQLAVAVALAHLGRHDLLALHHAGLGKPLNAIQRKVLRV